MATGQTVRQIGVAVGVGFKVAMNSPNQIAAIRKMNGSGVSKVAWTVKAARVARRATAVGDQWWGWRCAHSQRPSNAQQAMAEPRPIKPVSPSKLSHQLWAARKTVAGGVLGLFNKKNEPNVSSPRPSHGRSRHMFHAIPQNSPLYKMEKPSPRRNVSGRRRMSSRSKSKPAPTTTPASRATSLVVMAAWWLCHQ